MRNNSRTWRLQCWTCMFVPCVDLKACFWAKTCFSFGHIIGNIHLCIKVERFWNGWVWWKWNCNTEKRNVRAEPSIDLSAACASCLSVLNSLNDAETWSHQQVELDLACRCCKLRSQTLARQKPSKSLKHLDLILTLSDLIWTQWDRLKTLLKVLLKVSRSWDQCLKTLDDNTDWTQTISTLWDPLGPFFAGSQDPLSLIKSPSGPLDLAFSMVVCSPKCGSKSDKQHIFTVKSPNNKGRNTATMP